MTDTADVTTGSETVTTEDPASAGRARYYLEQGHIRLALIKSFAEGVRPATLARQYGVPRQTLHDFKERHKWAIAEVKKDLEAEFAGLWAANKANRVASYQDVIERLQKQIDMIMAESDVYRQPTDSEALTRLIKARNASLRSIAEELGALPQRIQMTVAEPVRHIIEIPGLAESDLT